MAAPVITSLAMGVIEDTIADVSFVLTGAGTYGVCVLLEETSAPTDSAVVAGTVTSPVFEIGPVTVTTTKNQHIILTGLTPGLEYTVYVATEDGAEDNAMSNVDFTTLRSIPNPILRQQQTPF